MDNKELIGHMKTMEQSANTRIDIACRNYDKAVKYEEGYKQALWDVEKLINKK